MTRYLIVHTLLLIILNSGCGKSFDSASSAPTSDTSRSVGRRDAMFGVAAPTGPAENGAAENGTGPGQGGDKFEAIDENPFLPVAFNPLSTFSIDVDTASYSKIRTFLFDHHRLPPPGSVRIEEMVNYFIYDYQGPTDEHPFGVNVEVAACPWKPMHRLVRIALKGKELPQQERPLSNLVFLLDVSGSMQNPNKLPLLKRGMKMLVDQLGENDRVAMVVYAGAAGLVLPSTSGDDKTAILDALEKLAAGGSTNGGNGIQLAYQVALDNFIPGGTNRVILCTDGDFNVGTTSNSELIKLVEANAKQGTFLTVLGFGTGNHNDSMLEQISNKGNGNYAFIDSDNEARKVLVEQMNSTLVTIAKDVKIQVEFNPTQVSAYRLIGYENRLLASEDFNDDQKDAGEIGAGHAVTALYEVIPAGVDSDTPVRTVDPLRYQKQTGLTETADSGELLTLKLRYKLPQEDESKLLAYAVTDGGESFSKASHDFKFAAAVASFGMLLRDSAFKGDANYAAVIEIASDAVSDDPGGYRQEFLRMVESAQQLGS
jgi:Ca-activated chloride channel family protein